MNLKNIGKDYSYIIFSDGTIYFIPGEIQTTFSEEFNHLSIEEYIDCNFSLGSGWLFDQNGINEIKRIFENNQVPYAEVILSTGMTYNP